MEGTLIIWRHYYKEREKAQSSQIIVLPNLNLLHVKPSTTELPS